MLKNRVDPWGALCAVPDRGSLMGNRGILHDANKAIVHDWQHKGWVTCLLSFKGIKRVPFSQGNYSELFFLDEATAFAAGHRPCARCQPARNREFKAAWAKANGAAHDSASLTMPEIDRSLHADRVEKGGGKRTFQSVIGDLPFGTFFDHSQRAFVKTPRGSLPWSFGGYGQPVALGAAQVVSVLTPQSVVRAFSTGFVPCLHASAGG